MKLPAGIRVNNNGKYESTTPNYVNDYCLLRSVDILETGNYSISITDSEITPTDTQQPAEETGEPIDASQNP